MTHFARIRASSLPTTSLLARTFVRFFCTHGDQARTMVLAMMSDGAHTFVEWLNDRKPEPILFGIFVASSVFAGLAAAYLLGRNGPPGAEVTEAVLIIILFLILVEFASANIVHYAFAVVLHAAGVIFVFSEVGLTYPLISLMLFCSFALSFQFRFPLIASVFVIGIVTGIQIMIAVGNAHSTIEIAVFCAVVVAFSVLLELLIFYREDLAKRVQSLNSAFDTIGSLSAANESFIRQLPGIRIASAEAERKRITRDLHDSLGYALTNIITIMNAASYIYEENPRTVVEYCLKTKDLAAKTMEETRNTLYRLRSLHESPENIPIFFMKMCRDFEQATGIETTCHPGNLPPILPAGLFNVLLRSAQVGFINALRHSDATTIRLFFWDDDSTLKMTVWNSVDTSDVDRTIPEEGIGLQGIRERLSELDGNVKAGYTVDGFNLIITIPNTNTMSHGNQSTDR